MSWCCFGPRALQSAEGPAIVSVPATTDQPVVINAFFYTLRNTARYPLIRFSTQAFREARTPDFWAAARRPPLTKVSRIYALRPFSCGVLGDISHACMQASPDLAYGARVQSDHRLEENRRKSWGLGCDFRVY